MSRGKTVHKFINRSIVIAAGILFAAAFLSPAPAQYNYQSIISADSSEKKTSAPAATGISEKTVSPSPENPIQPVKVTAVSKLNIKTSSPANEESEFTAAPALLQNEEPASQSPSSVSKSAVSAQNTKRRRPTAESINNRYTSAESPESAYSLPQENVNEEFASGTANRVPERVAQTTVPVTAQGASSAEKPKSGLLPEQTNDGILPPPDDYQITQDEAALLDQFLTKWEEFGKDIKKVSCKVETKERGGGLYGEDDSVPLSHNYGEFRFIAPNKLLYHIQGEFQYGKEEDGKKKPEFKKGLGEKKFVLDGKSLTEYDFKNRVALVTPIPEDQQNKDLTMDGPIPIFFIAKADNLKRRFYMKLITKPEKQDKEVWIEAWPRQAADAQSFQRIIITLRLSDLQPYYMRQYHTNGKSYSELWFYDISVNKGLWSIEPKIDFGWKREEAAPSNVSSAEDDMPAKSAKAK